MDSPRFIRDVSKLNIQSFKPQTQWLFLVPLKGGIGSIFHPPEGNI